MLPRSPRRSAGGSGRVHAVGWSLEARWWSSTPSITPAISPRLPCSRRCRHSASAAPGPDGTRVAEDYAGTGGGGVNPEFARRLAARDPSEEDALSSPWVIMRTYYDDGTNAPEADEQMLFDEFMKTVCGEDNYPGTMVPCDHWPGFGAGDRGGQNDDVAEVLRHFGVRRHRPKPPVLGSGGPRTRWSVTVPPSTSACSARWARSPAGPERRPTRRSRRWHRPGALLERYAAGGGSFREVRLDGVGHGALVERPAEVADLLADHVRAHRLVITRTVAANDGISLHVEEVGNGQPVVFVQGLGYAAWAWHSQIDAVGRVARAVVMDNRGAGRSEKPPAPYSIEQMADDVARVIDSCSGGPAMVVGA